MKKVRFESSDKSIDRIKMNESECHSPRPLIERQVHGNAPNFCGYPKVLPYSSDPVQLFECSNSSPYPSMNKTQLPGYEKGPNWPPSHDLELSMLDASCDEPMTILKPMVIGNGNSELIKTQNKPSNPHVLSTNENKTPKLPNVLVKDDDFFIRKDNLSKLNLDMNPLQRRIEKLSLDKENNPLAKKAELMQMVALNVSETNKLSPLQTFSPNSSDCRCYHCIKAISTPQLVQSNKEQTNHQTSTRHVQNFGQAHCSCMVPLLPNHCSCCKHLPPPKQCPCNNHHSDVNSPKLNAVDKKTWAIEKYEQSKKSDSMEVEKQMNVSKEKREPTVSDLFKIIKLQNEQLQLLQEKVDKFISASQKNQPPPAQNCLTEHVSIQTVDNEQHKISIGVMTSFEMVRTSTIINKEVLKTNENAQIQCNRSQISIKEVVSKVPASNLNFLDGIAPVDRTKSTDSESNGNMLALTAAKDGMNEEKTFNELSLYNVQVDNATTPLMSPEQSLYLDVRDYSDSDAESDQSNVGWTYYNKVMTHVNGMLQDSDMPSSASAMYRNTRQQMQTVQMQIDKTNVSVTKRVKFGDDPLGLHQPHIYTTTDTSLKMNQLAAKYLNNKPVAAPQQPSRPATVPIDMSFATRNYMERHKLLQGTTSTARQSPPGEIPRFLDITALKQQPKFL